MSKFDEFKQVKAEIAERKKGLDEIVKGVFEEAAKEFFAANPEITSFGVTAATPYFNDGDPCIYDVHRDYPMVNGFDCNRGEWLDEAKNETDEEIPDGAAEKVAEFLNNFDDGDFLCMFGDHIRITVTPAGVTTEDYEHD